MELLAPAGNRKALDAAIAAGADAVYLGYTAFSARSYAGNFDDKGLTDAVRAAHQAGRKVYVTVNTLVKETEIPELLKAMDTVAASRADAVLIQDLGVLRLARLRHPELPLHASTQMTVNNVQGVRLLKKLGIQRVVPARECRLSELKAMAETGTEIEAFVHGALCVCVSGQCLFSGMIGGRSGNRGKCSQPCRLPYTLSDGTAGYLLSPKDLMLINRVRELRAAGIASLKIEGRMKSPEYVATVTDAYRQAIDHPSVPVTTETLMALKQVFNRGGFTEGYVFSRNHAALMSWEKPNHWGIPVGHVTHINGRSIEARADMALASGDVLQVRSGSMEQDCSYNGQPVRPGMTFRITFEKAVYGLKPDDTVWRLVSVRQNEKAHVFTPEERKRIKLSAVLEAIPGKPARLSFMDPDGRNGEAIGSKKVEMAGKNALDEETVRKSLGKLRETPYVLDEIKLIGEQAFMPVSELNALRRSALEALMRPVIESGTSIDDVKLPHQSMGLTVVTENLSEASGLIEAGADQVAWMPRDYRTEVLEAMLQSVNTPVIFVLPTVTETVELQALSAFVQTHASQFIAVQVNNIGQIGEKWPVPLVGGQGLNVMNSECAKLYTQLGVSRLTVSCELNAKELRDLMASGGDYELECYGRVQLMMLTHCPRRTRMGDQTTDGRCNACASEDGWCETLTDRKGMQFKLRR
ncbi:MAG: U32 family peptidase, partial [Clostridia bacterium]|nr:U32 family peptidase [Clostridia bacterium]